MKKTQTNHRQVVYSLSLVALLLVSGITVASEPMMEDPPALIIVDDSLEIDTVVEDIRGLDGTVSHVFPPHAIIGQLSVELGEHLIQDAGITVYRGPVDVEDFSDLGKETMYAVTAWNYNYMGLSVDAGLNEPPVSPEPPLDDAEILPDISSSIAEQYSGEIPYGAEFADTSAYLVGSVAVGVIFLESNGLLDEETENWTEEEEANVTSEIQNGLNWLIYQGSDINLSFVYEWHYSVPVGYEPVTRPHTDDDLWEQQAMHHLGYGNPHYLVNEYSYANDLRSKYNTDWAFIIFVVDSSEDEDNAFADGYYAYSFLGGPRMVLTYSNSIWGIANMDSLVAHETCHIFWALDQHCQSQVEQTAVSGYLGGETTNSEWNGESCTPTVPCIMKGESMYNSQVEVSTRTQLGWLDSDSDGIVDVLDTIPAVTVHVQQGTGTGTAQVSPLPNKNPTKENGISLNSITTVHYKIDEGEWEEAEPVDGSFDGPEEAYSFTFSVAESGEHTIEVKAQNNVGNWSDLATATVTVEEKPYLQSDIAVSPETVNPEDTVRVIMTVQNTGEAEAENVVPVLTVPDTVTYISGPDPESADIPAGESQSFEWVYQVKATEGDCELSFSGSATGYTGTEEEIFSQENDSNNIAVVVEPLPDSEITALLYGVIEENTITLYMEVYNAGEVPLENVTPSEVTVTCTGTAAANLLSGPIPNPPVTLEPDTEKTFEWKYAATPGPQGGTAVFTATVSGEAEALGIVSDEAKATVGVESPAILTTFIIATPREVAVGDIITVAMTVQNIGQAVALDVIPSELSVSGTGEVELEAGPSRTSVEVEGRSFEIVHWTYIATKEGTVTFSGSAQGTDASTGGLLSTPVEQSNPVTINVGQQEESGEQELEEPSDSESISDSEPEAEDAASEPESDSEDSQEESFVNPPPPSDTKRLRAETAIQNARELLEKARNLLEQKQAKNRDVRICGRVLADAYTLLLQAEIFLENGQYEEATNSAIAAMMKAYELLNCLNNQ